MKTLLFTLEYPPFQGGVANYYASIITNWPSQADIFVLDNDQHKLINASLPFLKWLPAIKALYRNIKNNKIEQVLVGHILPLGTVAYLLSRVVKFKYYIIFNGLDFSLASKNKKLLTKLILKNSSGIICGNSYTAQLVQEFLGSQKKELLVANPGATSLEVDQAEVVALKQKYNLDQEIILFSVGRLVRRKGFDMVIKALAKVDQRIDVIYFLAGMGPDEQYLKELVVSLGLEKKVIFANVSDKEKWAFLHLCDIFIMPARDIDGDYEGFGMVYLEANLAGKPVIAGFGGGVGDAVIDNLNGLLVDPKSEVAIATIIKKLAVDLSLRQRLGQAGKERALKDFNCTILANKIFNFLK